MVIVLAGDHYAGRMGISVEIFLHKSHLSLDYSAFEIMRRSGCDFKFFYMK